MEEKDIFRISIIGKGENGIDVRCDIETDHFNLVAKVINLEMKRHPGFYLAMVRAFNEQ